jgi:hypothetical protein
MPSFSRQRVLDADAHLARTKFSPKCTNNLSMLLLEFLPLLPDSFIPNVNQLALGPYKALASLLAAVI